MSGFQIIIKWEDGREIVRHYDDWEKKLAMKDWDETIDNVLEGQEARFVNNGKTRAFMRSGLAKLKENS